MMLSDQQSWRMDLCVFWQHTNLSEWASVALLKQVDWIVSNYISLKILPHWNLTFMFWSKGRDF